MSKQMLIKPEAGQTAQCVVQHGHFYALDFDTSSVIFQRADSDLLMSFEDGARLVLRDFYSESLIGDFFLELTDGNLLSARSVAESMEYALDDFVTDGNVYTAESYHAGDDTASVSGIVLSYDAEELSFPSQPLFEARGLEGLAAEDSFAAHSGSFTPVAPASADGGVFNAHLDQTGYIGRDESQTTDLLSAGQNAFDLTDEPALPAYGLTEDEVDVAVEIITPRLHMDSALTPFTANLNNSTGASIGEDASGARVFFPSVSREADLLLLDDLLDTTMPEELTAAKDRVPAFEDLFAPVPDEGYSMKMDLAYSEIDHMNTLAATDVAVEGSEQLLLAFLRMGSF